MRADSLSWEGPYPCRSFMLNPLQLRLLMLFLCIPIVVAILAAQVVYIMTALASGRATQSIPGSASVLFLNSAYLLFGKNRLFLLSFAVFFFDRPKANELTTGEKVYLGLSLFALLSPFVLVAVWHYLWAPYAYRMWLATFSEGWSPNNRQPWWSRIIIWNSQLQRFFDRVEVWMHKWTGKIPRRTRDVIGDLIIPVVRAIVRIALSRVIPSRLRSWQPGSEDATRSMWAPFLDEIEMAPFRPSMDHRPMQNSRRDREEHSGEPDGDIRSSYDDGFLAEFSHLLSQPASAR
jgi:hypothetical protein